MNKTKSLMNCRGNLVNLDSPAIMGILNLTPDSFSDGGRYFNQKDALTQAEKLVREGAKIIDIGPQSTRPGSTYLSSEEEIQRIGNLISILKKEFTDTLISVDTFYSETVRFAWNEGLDIINDISGGNYDPKMFETAGETGLPYVLMHVNSTYESMHDKMINEDIILHINKYFSEKCNRLLAAGVKDIILDPGFGFGKTVAQQHQMIDELEFLGFNNYPLLVGISRKSFIYKPLDKKPEDITEETQKLHRKVLDKGAKILRVHDVEATRKTIESLG